MEKIKKAFINQLYVISVVLPILSLIALLNYDEIKEKQSYLTLNYIADDIQQDLRTLFYSNLDKKISIERNGTFALISVYDILNDSKIESSTLGSDANKYTSRFLNRYVSFYGLSSSSFSFDTNNYWVNEPTIYFTNGLSQSTTTPGNNVRFDFFGNANTSAINLNVNYSNNQAFLIKTCTFNGLPISCNGGTFGTGTFNVSLNYTDSVGNSIFIFRINPATANTFTISYSGRTITFNMGSVAGNQRSIRITINQNALAYVNATFINNEQTYIMAYIPASINLTQLNANKSINAVVFAEG